MMSCDLCGCKSDVLLTLEKINEEIQLIVLSQTNFLPKDFPNQCKALNRSFENGLAHSQEVYNKGFWQIGGGFSLAGLGALALYVSSFTNVGGIISAAISFLSAVDFGWRGIRNIKTSYKNPGTQDWEQQLFTVYQRHMAFIQTTIKKIDDPSQSKNRLIQIGMMSKFGFLRALFPMFNEYIMEYQQQNRSSNSESITSIGNSVIGTAVESPTEMSPRQNPNDPQVILPNTFEMQETQQNFQSSHSTLWTAPLRGTLSNSSIRNLSPVTKIPLTTTLVIPPQNSNTSEGHPAVSNVAITIANPE